MPFYNGVLRAKLLAEHEAEKQRVEAATGERDALAALSEAERDGLIERG